MDVGCFTFSTLKYSLFNIQYHRYLPVTSAARVFSPYFSVKALLNKGLGFCEHGMHHLILFCAKRRGQMLTAK